MVMSLFLRQLLTQVEKVVSVIQVLAKVFKLGHVLAVELLMAAMAAMVA